MKTILLWILLPVSLCIVGILWLGAAILTVYAWLKDYRHLSLREFWRMLHA